MTLLPSGPADHVTALMPDDIQPVLEIGTRDDRGKNGGTSGKGSLSIVQGVGSRPSSFAASFRMPAGALRIWPGNSAASRSSAVSVHRVAGMSVRPAKYRNLASAPSRSKSLRAWSRPVSPAFDQVEHDAEARLRPTGCRLCGGDIEA